MCCKPFVFYNMSKTYKVYDINLTLRRKGSCNASFFRLWGMRTDQSQKYVTEKVDEFSVTAYENHQI